jgi:hypothetical protein
MLRWKYLFIACSLALTIGAANATTFDWSITGAFDNGNGTLIASGSGGALTVTSISGTISTAGIESIFGPFDITGPLAPGSTYASLPVPGDNLLFYPAASLVDSNGISFSVEQAAFPGQQFMNIFFIGGQYFLLLSNSSANAITFSVSPEISSTPLPAAFPLFASGLGALGLLGWRRKTRKAAPLAAWKKSN